MGGNGPSRKNMRLLIELKALYDFPYNTEYHNHLQGFIYNLLNNSPFDGLHDSKGYKQFVFSNIFPFDFIKTNDIRTFLISSPNESLIRYLYDMLRIRESPILIGYMKFKINFLKIIYPKLNNRSRLKTGTPIVIRIPHERYKEFGYESIYDNFTYWSNEQPVDVFLKLVTENLVRKYSQFYSKSLDAYNNLVSKYKDIKLFNSYIFRRTIATKIWVDSIEHIIKGSLWEFNYNHSYEELIQFGLDSGLGERNSFGFGFMNPK